MNRKQWNKIAFWAASGVLVGGAAWYLLNRSKSSEKAGKIVLPPRPFEGNQKGLSVPGVCAPVSGFGAYGLTPDSCPADPLLGFPKNEIDRESYILQQVTDGNYEANWAPLVSSAKLNDGKVHTAVFWVLGDALKVNGVRVIASAYLQQSLANLLRATPLTPKLADLVFEQANVRLNPINVAEEKVSPASTKSMIARSFAIDEAIKKAGHDPSYLNGKIVSTLGNQWVLASGVFFSPKTTSATYGKHYWFDGKKHFSTDQPSSTNSKIYVEQPVELRPGLNEVYPSNNVLLLKDECTLDGEQTTIPRMLYRSDDDAPNYEKLFTHEFIAGWPYNQFPGVPFDPKN